MTQRATNWLTLIKSIKDGRSRTVRRETIIIDCTRPFGKITRNGDEFRFEPTKKVLAAPVTKSAEDMAEHLANLECFLSFNAY